MEKSIMLLDMIRESFDSQPKDIRTYSPLTLAYIGDGVYELIIRTVIVEKGNTTPENLHKQVTKLVKAETQCAIFLALEQEELTDEEQSVMRRGRNARSYTTAKNASVSDYRKASGLEALFGYLYLSGQTQRAIDLLKLGLEKIELNI